MSQLFLGQDTARVRLAEAGGFEPPVRLPVRQFSKLVVSATHPHFQSSAKITIISLQPKDLSTKVVSKFVFYL